jgi:outer membrane protein assembly factor BamB
MSKTRLKAISLLVVVLGVSGLAGLLGACCAGLQYGRRIVRGTTLPIPPHSDIRGSDLLITNWDPEQSSETLFVTYVAAKGNTRQVLWDKKLEACDDCSYNPHALFDENLVYYLAGDRMLALNQEDGTTVWETFLTDLVSPSCEQCIWKAKGHIVVLTTDYVLQGIDAEDGSPAWSVRLNNPSAAYDGFSMVNDQVVLLDYTDADTSDRVLRAFDPASGLLLQETAPTCPDNESSVWFDEVLIEHTGGGRAIFVYDCWSDPFIQSWRLVDGQEMWRSPLPEEAGSSPDSFVIGQDRLYLNTSDGLFSTSLSTGQTEHLADLDPDYDLTLLTEREGVLIGKARRTRGSTRYELWGLSPSGKRIWQYEIQADTLFGVDSGSADWAYRIVPDGLVVIQVLDNPEDHVAVAMLNPQNGDVIQESELVTDVSSLDGLAWDGAYAYVTVWGDVYTIDLDTLDIERGWP